MSAPRPSSPIPISHHVRARSGSESSESSSGSPPLQTPRTSISSLPRIAAGQQGGGGPGGSPSSPILSFLSGQSPLKSPAAYPFTRGTPFASAVDDEDTAEPPVMRHARRASAAASIPPRFGPGVTSPTVALPGTQQDRGVGLLRRLSLGGAFGRPQIPTAPGKPTTPPPIMEERFTPSPGPAASAPAPPQVRTKRRSATLGVDPRQRRAPSPMGERILKGHFDGFN